MFQLQQNKLVARRKKWSGKIPATHNCCVTEKYIHKINCTRKTRMKWANSYHTRTTIVLHKINCIQRKQPKRSGRIPATLIQLLLQKFIYTKLIAYTENNKNAVGGFLPHSYNHCVTEMYTKLIAYTKKKLSGRIPDTLGKTVHKSDAAQADEIHSYTHSLQICTMPRLQSVFNRCSSWVVSSTDCIKYTSYQRHRDGWVQRSRLHKLLSIDIIRGRYFVLKSAGGTFAKAISCMTVIMAFNRSMSSGR